MDRGHSRVEKAVGLKNPGPRCKLQGGIGGDGVSILGLGAVEAHPAVVGAGFWIRALARIIDIAYGYVVGLLGGIAAVIVLVILQALSLVQPGWALRMQHGRLLLFPLSLIGTLLYHTISEGGCGASLGKLICGVRVLSEQQTRCSYTAALIRSLAYFVDGLVFGLVGYLSMNKTQLQQRHGDHWARTIVVPRAQVPAASASSGWTSLGAVAVGTFAWALPMTSAMVVLALGG